MSTIISQGLILSESLDFPLTHARIGYQSVLTSLSITSATPGLTGYPVESALNPATFERYKPNANVAQIDITLDQIQPIDYFAMKCKGINLLQGYYSEDGITWILHSEYNISGQTTLMLLFEEIEYRHYRLILSGDNMEIVKMNLGKALAMQRAIYGGHSPITLNRNITTRPNVSGTGQFLGSVVKRQGLKGKFAWKNLTPDWYRNFFDPFAAYIPQANPFFISWRPADYGDEVAYCLMTTDISPSNNGRGPLMDVGFSVEGFSDVE